MKSLFQTQEWADLRVSQGWKSHEIEGIFVLEKKLPMGKSFLYAPEVTLSYFTGHLGPDEDTGSGIHLLDSGLMAAMTNFLKNTREIAQKSNTIFLRLDILDENNPETCENLTKNGFVKAFEEIQPEWRQIIDIGSSEDEILAQMKPKGRYNIKVAEKHAVTVEKIDETGLIGGVEVFYNLFCETAKNQDFSIRSKKYFQDLLLMLYSKGWGDLFIVRFEGQPAAGLIVSYYDGVASYLYGASSAKYRQAMAPYMAHWQVIKEAKKRGCLKYDLLAVAPGEEGELEMRKGKWEIGDRENPISHKYAGITRFKEQFGGRKVHLIGSWDYVYQPTWYRLFRMAEKMRRK